MNEFFKSTICKCFLYTLLCVVVFMALNLLIGWLSHNPEWLFLKDIRPAITLFIGLNLWVDMILIKAINDYISDY